VKVAAYCGRDWARAMKASTGVKPATSPPLKSGSARLHKWLEKTRYADVVALNLHGYVEQANYLGQHRQIQGPTALSPADVLEHRWDGVTVFLEVCFSASENSLIPQAFYARGAKQVIGSETEAYGRIKPTIPLPGFDGEADRLLSFFLFWLRRGKPDALRYAKRTLRLWSWPLDENDKQTLKSFTKIRRSDAKAKVA